MPHKSTRRNRSLTPNPPKRPPEPTSRTQSQNFAAPPRSPKENKSSATCRDAPHGAARWRQVLREHEVEVHQPRLATDVGAPDATAAESRLDPAIDLRQQKGGANIIRRAGQVNRHPSSIPEYLHLIRRRTPGGSHVGNTSTS